MTKKRAILGTSVAFVVALLDGVFKYLALQTLPESGRVLFPVDLLLYKNPGIAFNIPLPLPLVTLITIVILVAILPYAIRYKDKAPERAFAVLTIAFGAINNLIDRLINGFTTDYLIFFGRSVINLSDILIVTGVFLLLVYTRKRSGGRENF